MLKLFRLHFPELRFWKIKKKNKKEKQKIEIENKIKLEIHTFAGTDYWEEAVFKNCQMKIEYVDIENADLPKEYTEHLRIHKKHLKGE